MADSKVKIIYIHHDGGLGGAPISLSFLLPCIPRRLYDIRLLLISRGPVEKIFEKLNLTTDFEERIHPFHGSTVSGMSIKLFVRNFLYLAQSFFFSLKYLKKHQPDVIHLNSSCLFIIAFAAKMISKKIKVICHIREPLRKRSISGYIIKIMSYLFVDHFIAIDRYSASSMMTKGNCTVVYNSVDFAKFHVSKTNKSNILEGLDIDNNRVIFLYLARVDKSNGVLELLKAISAFQKLHSADNASFIIAGFRSNDNKRYIQKVNAVIEEMKHVHKLDFVENVVDLIASAHVMLVPFTEPHFARCIIEASAMGVPSIGRNIQGVNELIKDGITGYLYDSDNDFIKHCSLIVTDFELRRYLSENALAFARAEFDHEKNAEKVLAIYRSLQV